MQEVQQAHRLYLSSVKATKKADWIFRHLSDLMVPPQPPTTAKEMIGLVDQLSVDEIAELRILLNNRFSSGTPIEAPSATGSGPLPTDGGTGSDLTFQPLNPQETAPEYVLRKLHEGIQVPHEKLAAQIRQAAEEYAQIGKSRRSRAEYRKLGEYYKTSAEDFIGAETWELGADCYARARLAYTASRRYSDARQCATGSGNLLCHAGGRLRKRTDLGGRRQTLRAFSGQLRSCQPMGGCKSEFITHNNLLSQCRRKCPCYRGSQFILRLLR